MLRRLNQSLLRHVGYNLIELPAADDVASAIKEVIEREAIDLVLDVGAFHGDSCKVLRADVGYQGPIVSFEPCAATFDILSRNMRDDKNWKGYKYGLSDTDATATLNTYGDRSADFNSLLTLRADAAKCYQVSNEPQQETITLRRLDSIWDEICTGSKVFLKIDTQGHDTAVVRGAVKHMHFIAGLQAEIANIELYDGITPALESLRFYRQLGFVPLGFFPVNRPDAYPVPPEFDVVFRRFSTDGEHIV